MINFHPTCNNWSNLLKDWISLFFKIQPYLCDLKQIKNHRLMISWKKSFYLHMKYIFLSLLFFLFHFLKIKYSKIHSFFWWTVQSFDRNIDLFKNHHSQGTEKSITPKKFPCVSSKESFLPSDFNPWQPLIFLSVYFCLFRNVIVWV